MPDITRQIFLAFMRVHLLHHAAEGPIFGLEMIEELGRHGYKVSAGTLYPILHNLEAQGLLVCTSEVVGGKVRKYYRITPKGSEVLSEVLPKVKELTGEVLHHQPSMHLTLEDKAQ